MKFFGPLIGFSSTSIILLESRALLAKQDRPTGLPILCMSITPPLIFLQLDAAALWVYKGADGKDEGPVSLAHLRALVIGGQLSPRVQVKIQERSRRDDSCLDNGASIAVAIMLRCEVS
jgi:hypothetical protein